jgi:deoxycytidine triphosphate deaminase
MSKILRDQEIKALFGTVIKDGDANCIRPNCYILRLGSGGEFLNTSKRFALGTEKKGIVVPPGHSVGLTAFETLDFRPETVQAIHPGKSLHGLVTPTTDLAREGVVAPAGQVDSGYDGTLNFTVVNTSNVERKFIHKERMIRLTIFLLDDCPETPYAGEYKSQHGYVPSQRKGAPSGMRQEEWEHSSTEGGPESSLETLIKSGYPWNLLGKRLKIIDEQFQSVTNEYGDIRDSFEKVGREVVALTEKVNKSGQETTAAIRVILTEEAEHLQNRWLVTMFIAFGALFGLAFTLLGSSTATAFVQQFAAPIGLSLIGLSLIVAMLSSRRKKR